MASSKGLFEADLFQPGLFAAGLFRGIGLAPPVGVIPGGTPSGLRLEVLRTNLRLDTPKDDLHLATQEP